MDLGQKSCLNHRTRGTCTQNVPLCSAPYPPFDSFQHFVFSIFLSYHSLPTEHVQSSSACFFSFLFLTKGFPRTQWSSSLIGEKFHCSELFSLRKRRWGTHTCFLLHHAFLAQVRAAFPGKTHISLWNWSKWQPVENLTDKICLDTVKPRPVPRNAAQKAVWRSTSRQHDRRV